MTDSAPDSDAINVWVSPPNTPLPVKRSEVRFAIGTPSGRSSNSWKVWVRGQDTYVACRDNFREIKVSLHASGTWRLGFVEQLARTRLDIVPPGKDRVWKKWSPVFDESNRAVTAFQVLAPTGTLYLAGRERQKWPTSVMFLEPPADRAMMTVVSVTVVLGLNPVRFPEGTRGAVVGLLPLGQDRTVQLVATHEPVGVVVEQLGKALQHSAAQLGGSSALPPTGVIFVMGERGANTAWVSAARFQRNEGSVP